MPFKFFIIPVHSTGAEAELNAFLRSHKVLAVDRRWTDQGSSSFWSFCVDYLDTALPASATSNGRPPGAKARVDYKEILSEQEFALYARLREVRKQIAQHESVPIYAVFTNEQLAGMVQQRVTSAFTTTAGVSSWRFRQAVLQSLPVSSRRAQTG